MSVLSKKTIIELCEDTQTRLVEPYTEKEVHGSSYDLQVGSEYYICSPEKVEILTLAEAGKFSIPAYKVCFVLTEEEVHIPNYVTAQVTLKSKFIQQGLVLSSQPPIDPGYNGKIYALLHNLSNRTVQLQRGVPFLSVVFYTLDKEVLPYDEEYQGMTTLKRLTHLEPFESALKELEEASADAIRRYEATLPGLLRVVTITVAVIAVLLTLLALAGLVPFIKDAVTNWPTR